MWVSSILQVHKIGQIADGIRNRSTEIIEWQIPSGKQENRRRGIERSVCELMLFWNVGSSILQDLKVGQIDDRIGNRSIEQIACQIPSRNRK